jgi:ABC-2 type transport system permease protein
MSAARFAAVTGANLRMTYRNRSALFFSLALPIMFMVIFGLIFGNAGNERLKVDVAGNGPLVEALALSPAIDPQVFGSAGEAIARVRDGKDAGAVVSDGRSATLYYSNTYASQAAMLQGIVRGVAGELNLRATGRPELVHVSARPVESSSLQYIDFLVPGLIAMALCQSAVFGIAGTLVSWRERGIFRRLRVTPLPLAEFGSGRLLSSLALALTQTAILLAVGWAAFGVHLSVNLLALLPLVIVGALCFLSIGFFVGAVARTQDAAAAIANVITLPMVFLAGVFFSLDTAPAWLAQVAKALPLTYLADGLRDVAIRGHSLASTLPDLAVLGGVSLLVAALTLRVFRWDAA